MTTEIELLNRRIDQLEVDSGRQRNNMIELIEYLERVDAHFMHDVTSMENWHLKLARLKMEEKQKNAIIRAKSLLKKEGFIVVEYENEIDAARLKKWITSQDDT